MGIIMEIKLFSKRYVGVSVVLMQDRILIYEVLKIRDFSKLLTLLFPTATPPRHTWGRDPPVGNH